jgi:FAD/FMN-containing dehydrogenase
MSKSLLQALIVALAAVASATKIPTKGPSKTCKLIDSHMPGLVSYPNTTAYDSSLSTYYSSQERELSPGCIFRPAKTQDVSQFIQLVTAQKDTKFAVRGGGHTLFTGAANIDGGITVDMRGMKDVVLSQDHKVARLGAGGIFSEIYPQLVPHNLTVMGARVPGIGVGGFVTGGKYLRLKGFQSVGS